MNKKNGTLIKKINGENIIIYPETSAENVKYGNNSNIKQEIDNIKEALNMPVESVNLMDESGNILVDDGGLPLISI